MVTSLFGEDYNNLWFTRESQTSKEEEGRFVFIHFLRMWLPQDLFFGTDESSAFHASSIQWVAPEQVAIRSLQTDEYVT